MKERHPSTFDLDVFFVRGKREDDVVEFHLQACDRCRQYVAELERWTIEKRAQPSKGRAKLSLVESARRFGLAIRRFARAMRSCFD